MKEGGDGGFVRADQIDLKCLDEQLDRHLNRVRTTEKKSNKEANEVENGAVRIAAGGSSSGSQKKQREEWEIDPSKLVIKGVIARGTFGTVHRGVYDGQEVAVHTCHCRLSYLHSKKIVHRDVKTENMLLDKTRTVKIADFGVARIEAQNPNDMTGETGTLGYMAPEVLNGNPYNRRCDVYSFGICLWEIYCCDMPYPDLSFSEITSAVVRQDLRPEIPRCCPSSLANVMKRCWDANPDKRPEMDEVVSMLESIDTSKGGGMIPLDKSQGCLPCFRKCRGP